MDENFNVLLSVAEVLAGIGGLLAAAFQTIRLRKVTERAEADIWESIGVTRGIVNALTAGKEEAAIVGATHLRRHLIKEVVLQQRHTDSRKLAQWVADGKITDEEFELAKQFIASEPPSFGDKLGTVVGRHLSGDDKSRELLEVIGDMGIAGAPESFPSDLISRGIYQAREKVRIATTWIHSIPLQSALSKAVANCSVEILLLDPDSAAAAQRSVDLEYPKPEDVPNHIRGTLYWLKRVLVKNDNNAKGFQLGLYRTAPTFLMYLFDDTLVYCPALHGDKPACSRRQFVVKGKDSELYRVMEEQFLLISKRSRFIDLSEWPSNPTTQGDGSAAN